MTSNPEVSGAIHRIAAFGLSQRPGRRSEDRLVEPAPEHWPSFCNALIQQRLTGLAIAAIDEGALLCSNKRKVQLLDHHRKMMINTLIIESTLITLTDAFRKNGLWFVVLKGPAFAHAYYPEPSWRPFVDLDILVRTNDWQRACALLVELGFVRKLPEPRAGFDERFGKAVEFKGSNGAEVDLHRTLVVGPYGLWIDVDILAEHTAPLPLGGRDLRRFDDTAALINACAHASLGWAPPLLLPLRDVLQIATVGAVDWALFRQWMKRWRMTEVVRYVVENAARYLNVAFPQQLCALVSDESNETDRRILETYTSYRRGGGGTELGLIRAIPGITDKIAYAFSLLFPSREFLTARMGGSKPAYAARLMIPVRWVTHRVRVRDRRGH
jgi:hypothetical protein